MTNSRDTLLPILGTLYPWRGRILMVTAAAFLLSVIFSLLMKNYYQGKTIFYAASQDLFKPEKVFGGGTQEMYYYGTGEDIDRIITVANSNEVIDYLIDSFNLWEVYDLKSRTPRSRYNMRMAFKDNYNIMLTKQDALELTVEDKDPGRAADLANAATKKIDHLVRSIIKNSQSALANSLLKSIHSKEAAMQQILDSLMHYREISGIYSPGEQTKILAGRFTEISSAVEREKASLGALRKMNLSPKLRDSLNIIQARIIGYERELGLLTSSDTSALFSLPNFNSNKGKVELLESRYLRAYEQIGYDLEKVKFYNAAVDIDVPALHMVENAERPLRKSRPRRSIIVLAVTAAAFLFSLAGALVVESYKRFDWRGAFQSESAPK